MFDLRPPEAGATAALGGGGQSFTLSFLQSTDFTGGHTIAGAIDALDAAYYGIWNTREEVEDEEEDDSLEKLEMARDLLGEEHFHAIEVFQTIKRLEEEDDEEVNAKENRRREDGEDVLMVDGDRGESKSPLKNGDVLMVDGERSKSPLKNGSSSGTASSVAVVVADEENVEDMQQIAMLENGERGESKSPLNLKTETSSNAVVADEEMGGPSYTDNGIKGDDNPKSTDRASNNPKSADRASNIPSQQSNYAFIQRLAQNIPSQHRPKKPTAAQKKRRAKVRGENETHLKKEITQRHLQVLQYGRQLLDSLPTVAGKIHQELQHAFAFERLENIAEGNMSYFKTSMREWVGVDTG